MMIIETKADINLKAELVELVALYWASPSLTAAVNSDATAVSGLVEASTPLIVVSNETPLVYDETYVTALRPVEVASKRVEFVTLAGVAIIW